MKDLSLDQAVDNITSNFSTVLSIYIQLQAMIMLFLRFGTTGNQLGYVCFRTIQMMLVKII